MPAPSCHFQIVFLGMSEKSRYLPDGTQTGPSDQSKPSASFSSLAVGAMSLSKRGSLRSMVPIVGYGCSAAAARETASSENNATNRQQVWGIGGPPGWAGVSCTAFPL